MQACRYPRAKNTAIKCVIHVLEQSGLKTPGGSVLKSLFLLASHDDARLRCSCRAKEAFPKGEGVLAIHPSPVTPRGTRASSGRERPDRVPRQRFVEHHAEDAEHRRAPVVALDAELVGLLGREHVAAALRAARERPAH